MGSRNIQCQEDALQTLERPRPLKSARYVLCKEKSADTFRSIHTCIHIFFTHTPFQMPSNSTSIAMSHYRVSLLFPLLQSCVRQGARMLFFIYSTAHMHSYSTHTTSKFKDLPNVKIVSFYHGSFYNHITIH